MGGRGCGRAALDRGRSAGCWEDGEGLAAAALPAWGLLLASEQNQLPVQRAIHFPPPTSPSHPPTALHLTTTTSAGPAGSTLGDEEPWIHKKGAPFGMPGVHVDGMDVLKVGGRWW